MRPKRLLFIFSSLLFAEEENRKLVCQCEGCLAKKAHLDLKKPSKWHGNAIRSV